MLQSLLIKNVALIEQLNIEFKSGFNVFTGETGAGKSIIIDAMNLALGERANRDLIQYGASKAVVEAVFDVSSSPGVFDALAALEIDHEDGQLVISREISTSGKNVCRVNGALVNLAALKSISDLLVDVHGQHEHQSLLLPARHIGFLDALVQEEISVLTAKTAQYAADYRKTRSEMLEGYSSELDREREMDVLAYQIGEIGGLKPVPGEEEALLAERQLLVNAERIMGALEESYALINGDGGALPAVHAAQQRLGQIAEFSEDYASLSSRLEEAYYGLEDIFYSIRDLRYGFEYNAQRLAEIEERLDVLSALKRKYGKSIELVLEFQERAIAQLESMKNAAARRGQLEGELAVCMEAYQACAAALTARRKTCAAELEQRMLAELGELGLERARFEVAFSLRDAQTPLANGLDEVEFMLSTNPGEPLKPLARVASGGELSRIMLAFKAILAGKDHIPTLIFDEIDTGISGKVGGIVGEKLMQIATGHQVICVTHLPQIAALADTHFIVEKFGDDDATRTHVRHLEAVERNAQIAQMMGGENSKLAYKHAEELVARSAALKVDLRKNLHS